VLEKLRSRLVHSGPSLLSVPVKLTPFAIKRQVLEQVLCWQFQQALADGELEFLEGRWLSIQVRDIGLTWYTSVENSRLIVRESAVADVSFSADASDLLMIARVNRIRIRCSFNADWSLKATRSWGCM
jgi:predicted lipid carrier protein YhbT